MKIILFLVSCFLLFSFHQQPPKKKPKKLYTQKIILQGNWRTEPMSHEDSILALELPPFDSMKIWREYDKKNGIIKSNK